VSEADRIIEANRQWAEQQTLSEMAAPPARGTAVVVCMDARIPVLEALGLAIGDAHVIRNAGGVVTEDTLRSLAISQHALGTRTVVLVHHTRCGMQTTTDADFADLVERTTGHRPPWPARTFTDVDADVRESLRLVRESPYLVSEEVRGTVYDIDTGLLREVS
jgi:carbonic anhydrase